MCLALSSSRKILPFYILLSPSSNVIVFEEWVERGVGESTDTRDLSTSCPMVTGAVVVPLKSLPFQALNCIANVLDRRVAYHQFIRDLFVCHLMS